MGGLERSKVRLGGVFFNKSKKISFAIFWHYVWRHLTINNCDKTFLLKHDKILKGLKH